MTETQPPAPAAPEPRPRDTALAELALLFLKLGTIAFGGPAAHIAMMEDEVVRRRRWMTRQEFLDMLSATYLIPGPNSTEMAIHVCRLRAGGPGLLVAGACFILPAALIVAALAWAYVRFGALPDVSAALYGVKPVVIAVVVQALWGFGRAALRTWRSTAIGLGALVATALGVHELIVLAAAGLAAVLVHGAAASFRRGRPPGAVAVVAAALPTAPGAGPRLGAGAVAGVAAGAAAATPFGLWPLFAVFLKVGAVLFGSGYVLIAFLRADLVQRLHWLTEHQLLDAVAAGQVTPGPVFTTATFVGWVLGGPAGAAVATVGIFLPSFVFVALSGPLVPRLRRSKAAAAALDGVNAGSRALMAAVTAQLGRAALVDPLTIGLALASAILLFRFRVNSAWLVVAGAAIGIASRVRLPM